MINRDILKLAEELTRKMVDLTVNFRYDICACAKCKKDIINQIISKISASANFPNSDNIEEIKKSCQKEIGSYMLPAIEYVSAHPPHFDAEDREKTFVVLLKKISSERGLDLRNYHRELLKRRIALRLQKNNIPSYSQYLDFLSKNPIEYDQLFATLCINISEFFRDTPVWVTIKVLYENLFLSKIRNNQNLIRTWSCGCANGEEPYSLAITLQEIFKETSRISRVEILATDVDKACLDFAQKAVYSPDNLKNVSPKLLSRYFELSQDKFSLKNEIKKMAKFAYLDLTSQKYPDNIDVLTCRNVFIYFNRQLQKQILDKFYTSLNPGGYLIMGRSEILGREYENLFEVVDSNARIYRKLTTSF